MPYAILVKEIESLPQECFSEIAEFVQNLKKKYTEPTINSSSYPNGYFNLFGSINDETFKEPEELDSSIDAKRVSF